MNALETKEYLENRFNFKVCMPFMGDNDFILMEKKELKVDIYVPENILVVDSKVYWINNSKDIDTIILPLIKYSRSH